MKRTLILLSILALGAAFAAPAQAKDKGKGKSADGAKPAKILKEFDTNGNGVIDGDEVAAIKKAFDGGSAELKALDTDKDGKLSDAEISSIHGKKKKK